MRRLSESNMTMIAFIAYLSSWLLAKVVLGAFAHADGEFALRAHIDLKLPRPRGEPKEAAAAEIWMHTALCQGYCMLQIIVEKVRRVKRAHSGRELDIGLPVPGPAI